MRKTPRSKCCFVLLGEFDKKKPEVHDFRRKAPGSTRSPLPFGIIRADFETPTSKKQSSCLFYPALSWLRVHYDHVYTLEPTATCSNTFWAGSSHPFEKDCNLPFGIIEQILGQPAGKIQIRACSNQRWVGWESIMTMCIRWNQLRLVLTHFELVRVTLSKKIAICPLE